MTIAVIPNETRESQLSSYLVVSNAFLEESTFDKADGFQEGKPFS